MAKPVSKPLSRRLKAGFALAIALAAVLLAEAVAALVFHARPFQAFTRTSPGPGTEQVTFILNEHQPSFALPKPPSTFRIMVFGESAANGAPLSPGGGFPAFLEAMTRATRPGQTIEVLNFGVNGANTTKIREWFPESLDFSPDLLIFYIGNNEVGTFNFVNPHDHPLLYRALLCFRRHSRVYALLDGYLKIYRSAIISAGVGSLQEMPKSATPLEPESLRGRADALYIANLRAMIGLARKWGVAAVVVSPAANLREWPPLKSAHYRELAPQALARFEDQLNQGRQALARSDLPAAAKALAAALELDPQYAEAHYLYAKVLLNSGDLPAGREHFQLAREWDDLTLRSPYRFVRITREIAASEQAEYLDLDSLLGPAAPGGSPGFETFFDSVHFNAQGQDQAARILLEELSRRKLIPRGPDPIPAFAEIFARLPIPRLTMANSYLHMGIFLGFSFSAPEILEQARRDFETAKPYLPGDPFPPLAQAVVSSRLNDPAGLSQYLTEAYLASPHAAQVAARRFFPGVLELYQTQAALAVGPDTPWAGLALAVVTYRNSAHPAPLEPLEFGTIPLEKMTAALLWNAAEKRFLDLGPALAALREEKRRLEAGGRPPALDLLAEASALHLQAMTADWSRHRLEAQTPDSSLVISPFLADPLTLPILRLQAKFSAPAAPPNWLVIYWDGGARPGFSEDKKLTLSWPLDAETRTRDLPLGQILPLLLDRPLRRLRLDFTAQPATIELDELKLTPE